MNAPGMARSSQAFPSHFAISDFQNKTDQPGEKPKDVPELVPGDCSVAVTWREGRSVVRTSPLTSKSVQRSLSGHRDRRKSNKWWPSRGN